MKALPQSCVIVGSRALTVRGIDIGRQPQDWDIVVPHLGALGWPIEDRGDHRVAVQGEVEAMDSYNGKPYDVLMKSSGLIGDLYYVSVHDVLAFKRRRGTKKDLIDVMYTRMALDKKLPGLPIDERR